MTKVKTYHLPQRIIFDIILQFTDKNNPGLRVEFSPGNSGKMLQIIIKREPVGFFDSVYQHFFGKELSYQITHHTLFNYSDHLKMIIDDVEQTFNTKIHPQVDQLKL